jgi:Uma2 family endonuclease
MVTPLEPPEALPLDLSTLRLSDEQFQAICIANPDRPLELTSCGVLIVMPPVGGESGNREIRLGSQLFQWNDRVQLGEVFSSSTVFKLPLGSQRSPDAAWVEKSRWESLTAEQRKKFPPLAPDFIIELRSESDRLDDLREKMAEYRDNGVRLGILIDPQREIVECYPIDRPIEILPKPTTIDCSGVLPGFFLDLSKIWQ